MFEQIKQKPIDAALFRWPVENPALLASRCDACGARSFPASDSCPACGDVKVTCEELPRKGVLWAWTIQRFMPKAPYASSETSETFVPYGLGYIEFPGLLRIESRLTENDPGKLQIGAEMLLTFYIHRVDSDGTAVINYAFAPIDGEVA